MSDSSSSDDSSSDEQETQVQQKVVQQTTNDADSSSSDSDSSDNEQEAAKPAAKAAQPAQTADDDSSSSDSDSDSDEKEEAKPAPAKPVKAAAKEEDSSSDDSSSDEAEEKAAPAVKATPSAAAKDDDSSSDSDSDDAEAEKPAAAAAPAAESKDEDDSDDSSSEVEEEKPAEETKPVISTPAEDADNDADDESEEEDLAANLGKTVTLKPLFIMNLSAKSSRDRGRKRKLENAVSPQANKKIKEEKTESPASNKDMTPTKPFTPNSGEFKNEHLKGVSKTVFVKGISTDTYEKDIAAFFEKAIEKPARVKHKWDEERPGYAFVEFSSPAVATKAVIDCNNEYIGARWVNCDWAEDFKAPARQTRGPRNAHLKGTTSRIWMGNLHREVYDDQIYELFKDCGELTDVYIIGRDETRPKVAYVSFSSNDQATKAVEEFQGHSLMDYNIRLDWAEPRKDNGGNARPNKRKRELSVKEPGCLTVFMGGVSDEVDDDKIAEFLKDCGEISSIRYSEPFKGFAFIEFAETESTDKAVAKNGETFLGRTIRFDFAADKKKQRREY